MKRTIVSPWRFVVGPDILKEIGLHAKWLGGKALLVGGTRGLGATRDVIVTSLQQQGIDFHVEHGDHVTKEKAKVDALCAIAAEAGGVSGSFFQMFISAMRKYSRKTPSTS